MECYYLDIEESELQELKEILEDEKIKKLGIDLNKTYILLKQLGI